MFEKIFTKFRIGTVEIANRLVVPPMVTCFAAEDGNASEQYTAYHEARAKGGWGLIITENYPVVPTGRGFGRSVALYNDDLIASHAEVARRIHSLGSKVFVQIVHTGRQTSSAITGAPLVAPSPIPCPSMKEMPRELTLDEIHELVEAFGDTALRVKKAGFDGVEVHGAHGYLVAQFMSLYSNKRTDEYGGNLLNRLRFPLEIIANVRAKCGDDFPIAFRISADEFVPGGRTIQDTCAIASILESAGVAMIDVSVGVYGSMDRIIAPAAVGHGWTVDLAAAIKQVVSIPVMTTGRVNDPLIAEAILKSGKADLVGMGRASIADPNLPNKLKDGRYEDIVQCVGCLQGCIGGILTGRQMGCVVNPLVGMESELELTPAKVSRKVVVVGGGPAGMTAAIAAARRGHNVELFEKAGHLGGQYRLASIPPSKGEIATFLTWQQSQLHKLGVAVHLNTEVTERLVDSLHPDAVVVATGAVPAALRVPGMNRQNVVSAFDVLDGRVETGETVVVVGGGMVGAETANHLANHGKNVTIVEMLPSIAMDEQPIPRMHLLQSLEARHVVVDTGFMVKEVVDTGILAMNGKESLIEADTIVMAVGATSVSELATKLRDKPYRVITVGDAKSVRKVHEAVKEGFAAALDIN